MEVSGDKITKASDLSTIFNLASTKPVFLKMYEEWCGHCKKMKKHFQMASSDADSSVHFVEVECSAADPKVCAQFGVKGFPTVKLLALVDGEYKTYDYSGPRTAAPLADFAKDALSVASSGWEAYSGEVPDINDGEL
jgi:thioredoxin-like negative regulator of GroEL